MNPLQKHSYKTDVFIVVEQLHGGEKSWGSSGRLAFTIQHYLGNTIAVGTAGEWLLAKLKGRQKEKITLMQNKQPKLTSNMGNAHNAMRVNQKLFWVGTESIMTSDVQTGIIGLIDLQNIEIVAKRCSQEVMKSNL